MVSKAVLVRPDAMAGTTFGPGRWRTCRCDRAAEEKTEGATAEAARTMAVSSLVAARRPCTGQRAADEIPRTLVLFVPPSPGAWGDLLP